MGPRRQRNPYATTARPPLRASSPSRRGDAAPVRMSAITRLYSPESTSTHQGHPMTATLSSNARSPLSPPVPPPHIIENRLPSLRTAQDASAQHLWFAVDDIHEALAIKHRTQALNRVPHSHKAHRWFPLLRSARQQQQQQQLLPVLSPRAAFVLARRSRHPNAKALSAHILTLTVRHTQRTTNRHDH
jgi:hypothetical protein